MNTTTKTRHGTALYRATSRTNQAIKAACDRLGLLIGEGLKIHMGYAHIARADVAAEGVAYDQQTPHGHIMRAGTWERLSAADAAVIASEVAKIAIGDDERKSLAALGHFKSYV